MGVAYYGGVASDGWAVLVSERGVPAVRSNAVYSHIRCDCGGWGCVRLGG